MFPLQQGDELCFQITQNPIQQHKIPEGLILQAQATLHTNNNITNEKGKSGRPRLASTEINESRGKESNNIADTKKMMHRDTERLRRKEMATLYASLRSLLPLEFLKGKRSISDHMNQAINYIKHQQRKIKELNAKRDKLKRLSNLSALESQHGTNNLSPSSVMVRPCLGGVEIVFTSGSSGQDLPLSRVLKVLLDEGMTPVNCVSTKVNGSLIHSVQAEVDDPTGLNLTGLQHKLTLLASSSSD